jgi:threonine/homoserine/homoserine lactone efflux protein
MHLAVWFAFTVAYALMAAAPGPVIFLVVSYAITQGRRTAFAVVAGTTLGDATCLAAAALGAGAVLAASATAFLILKLAGAAYLVFLGIRLWRMAPSAATAEPDAASGSLLRIFAHAYLTTVLNPKSVLFFMVFVPQFIEPSAPLLPQLAAMLASVALCGTAVDGSYSLFAARLRRAIRSPQAQRLVHRVAGGTLAAEGVLAAAGRSLTL